MYYIIKKTVKYRINNGQDKNDDVAPGDSIVVLVHNESNNHDKYENTKKTKLNCEEQVADENDDNSIEIMQKTDSNIDEVDVPEKIIITNVSNNIHITEQCSRTNEIHNDDNERSELSSSNINQTSTEISTTENALLNSKNDSTLTQNITTAISIDIDVPHEQWHRHLRTPVLARSSIYLSF